MAEEFRSGMLSEYGLTLMDIEMNRHFIEVQEMVRARIVHKSLDPKNVHDQEDIMRIWCEVILKWKKYFGC